MKWITGSAIVLVLIILMTSCTFRLKPKPAIAFSESVVWTKDEGNIPERFVYGLAVANNGTILSFAEGRISPGDVSPHHIVLKRSKDNGATWLAEQIIVTSTNNTCYANPTPVVDKSTGDIFLFYGNNYSNDYSDLFYIISGDAGSSWSKAIKVTDLFKNDPLKRPFHLPGPGHGIQLQSGRLVVQVWHRFSVKLPANDRQYGVSVVYSDDHGKTWKEGGYIPNKTEFPVNESRLVEMAGRLVMNGRYSSSGTFQRIQSDSKDGGITWSQPYFSSLSAFTAVDAGVALWSGKNKEDHLLITRPVDTRSRKDLVISASKDEGKTWPFSRLIYEGPANYSDVIELPDHSIFVLYGRGVPRHVASARFTLDWLTEKDK